MPEPIRIVKVTLTKQVGRGSIIEQPRERRIAQPREERPKRKRGLGSPKFSEKDKMQIGELGGLAEHRSRGLQTADEATRLRVSQKGWKKSAEVRRDRKLFKEIL